MSDPDEHVLFLLGELIAGRLDPETDRQVESHLLLCSSCARERDDLEPVVHALALVGPLAAAGPDLPVGLLAQVEQRVAGERRAARRSGWRRRGTATLLAGAASAALFAGGLVVGGSDAPVGPVLEPVALQVERAGVVAGVDLVDHTWGVEIKLVASGLEPGTSYRVTLFDAAGTAYPAGEFLGVADRPVRCSLASALLRRDATSFEVRDSAGGLVIGSDLVAG